MRTPVVLRTAAAWGTTVLGVRALWAGQGFFIGDGKGAVVAKPDNTTIADYPIRAVATGWEHDARGPTGGEVFLRGRREHPAGLAASGAPLPIVAGDYGVVQYGNFSIFFQ